MKIKYIISLSMLVALIGASCWGAAKNAEQWATGINDEILAEPFAQQEAPGAFWEMPLDIFEFHILNHIPAAKLMKIALKNPKLYPSIRKIPQFIQLQQNMERALGMSANNQQKVFIDAARLNYPGAIDVIDYLAPYVNINAHGASGYTALISAASNNNLEMTELLLVRGADINAHNAKGYTALMLATSNNKLEMAKLLLAKGANINVRDIYGNTTLMKAASNNRLEMTELLLDKGANINVRNKYNNTALNLAENNLTHANPNKQDYKKRARTIIDLLTRGVNP